MVAVDEFQCGLRTHCLGQFQLMVRNLLMRFCGLNERKTRTMKPELNFAQALDFGFGEMEPQLPAGKSLTDDSSFDYHGLRDRYRKKDEQHSGERSGHHHVVPDGPRFGIRRILPPSSGSSPAGFHALTPSTHLCSGCPASAGSSGSRGESHPCRQVSRAKDRRDPQWPGSGKAP